MSFSESDTNLSIGDYSRAIELDPGYKDKAKSETKFNVLWKHPDFIKLVE